MFTNAAEHKTFTERQAREQQRAIWLGIQARQEGVGPDDNPYPWSEDLGSHGSMLYYRWLLGWLRQAEKEGAL